MKIIEKMREDIMEFGDVCVGDVFKFLESEYKDVVYMLTDDESVIRLDEGTLKNCDDFYCGATVKVYRNVSLTLED